MNKTKMSIVNLVCSIVNMIPLIVWIWYSTGNLYADLVVVGLNGIASIFNMALFLFFSKKGEQ